MNRVTIDQFKNANYKWLSNFYPCEIEFEGKLYPTAEHAYQAAKTVDDTQRELIRLCPTPGAAKSLGRKVDCCPEWELLDAMTSRPFKVEMMYQICRKKFFKHKELGDLLLSTEDHHLIENSTRWNDRFWGVASGRGQNWLGRILMDIREELFRARLESNG